MNEKPPNFGADWRQTDDLPTLDESNADQYIGKVVLVGVTFENAQGEMVHMQQWAGVIRTYSNQKGILVDLYDTEEPCSLPPFPDLLEPAEPGIYRLRSTGRVVERPDYLANLSCTAPQSEGPCFKE
ncbi:MAG: hypothetical protein HOH33_07100 [Verrucomicrobia bacterium]|jgi:hypothetical protein|nr:hypothetical protein [Verrucomicrobiota bacterium]